MSLSRATSWPMNVSKMFESGAVEVRMEVLLSKKFQMNYVTAKNELS
jgi:hypothetical protein